MYVILMALNSMPWSSMGKYSVKIFFSVEITNIQVYLIIISFQCPKFIFMAVA